MVRINSQAPHVIIVGAGPSGCLLALLLAEQGARVSMFEGRKDLRHLQGQNLDSRSINISLSTRGITALERLGLAKHIQSLGVPMYGRTIHRADAKLGETTYHPYGQPGQHLLAVSRTRVAHILQTAAESHQAVTIHFGQKCVGVDLNKPSVTVQDSDTLEQQEIECALVVGADGTFSRVRSTMSRQPGFNFSQEYNPLRYKELSFIPPNQSDTYNPTSLHVWPRHEFMLMTQPDWNYDVNKKGTSAIKTHTSAIFMPPHMFEQLDTDEKVVDFMSNNFPDAIPAMPNVAAEFRNNPAAPLLTVRCAPYNVGGKVVLIGDAAHAIVPFYGQGCNAALEDSYVLADIIEEYGWSALNQALDEYSRRRKVDADTIANLAIDNYRDMSTRTVSTFYVVKKRAEIWINKLCPSLLVPLYCLVSFTNVPYSKAVARAHAQDKVIFSFIGIASLLGFATLAAAFFSAFEQMS